MILSRLHRFSKSVDLAVIGGGPGGYVAAIKAAQQGLNVACIEHRGSLGGTCLNVGCIPSKLLINSAYNYHFIRHGVSGTGISVSGVTHDFKAIIANKDKCVKSLMQGIEFLFKKNKVQYLKGWSTIKSPTKVEVKTSSGVEELEAKNIIIATGSVPSKFPPLPFSKKVISSDEALSLPALPKSMVIVGAGAIGLEMASVFNWLGSNIVVLEYANKICPVMDHEISDALQANFVKQGIKINTNTKVTGGKETSDGVKVTAETNGTVSNYDCELVLVATGRTSFTKDLGLENIGVETVNGKIPVTPNLSLESHPNIYAIGDVIYGPMLAHKAEDDGVFVVGQITGQDLGHLDYNSVPSVIYTHPEVSGVGQTEQLLIQSGVKYTKGFFPLMANSRAKLADDSIGFVKVLADEQTGKLLGAWIFGTQASELIATFTLGITYGASVQDISRVCFAHPTVSESIKEACLAAHGKAIHF